jgi:hypothetical protein
MRAVPIPPSRAVPPPARQAPPTVLPDVDIPDEGDDALVGGDDISSTRVEQDFESATSSLETSPSNSARMGRRPPPRRAPRPPDDPAARTARARRRVRAGPPDLARANQNVISDDLKDKLIIVDTTVQSMNFSCLYVMC